jgi:uridine phosphorylase
MNQADQPRAEGRLQYHTHTREGDLSALCLIVGAPGRADMIAASYLKNAKRFSNSLMITAAWFPTRAITMGLKSR